jgi:outer membrane protein OmpA-like peptidoglycan-associated protein
MGVSGSSAWWLFQFHDAGGVMRAHILLSRGAESVRARRLEHSRAMDEEFHPRYEEGCSMRNDLLQSNLLRVALAALLLPATFGCSTSSRAAKGGVIGAGTGAVIGGVIGHQKGSTAKGVIIGAAVGGAAGAIIGAVMDRQAREIDQEIPGATVERVGEGIQVTFASGLLFDFDSARIRPDASHNLDALASSLHKYGKSNLMIVGHTDAIGSASYNQDLSVRRANSAAAYLESRGVSRWRVATRGLGEEEPVASNESESGRQQNRRVEVAIYASEAWQQEAKRQAPS